MAIKNEVLAGEYKGEPILFSIGGGAYIQKRQEYIYFDSLNVLSISEISRESAISYGKALGGTLLFGSGGASLGINGKEGVLLEVVWKNGAKSLVQVEQGMYKTLLGAMYEKTSVEKQQAQKEDDKLYTKFLIGKELGCGCLLPIIFFLGILIFS